MIETMKLDGTSDKSTQSNPGEFGRLVFFMFAIFFVIALVTRILPRGLRPLAATDNRHQSVYQEAMQAAHNVAPFVFMNH